MARSFTVLALCLPLPLLLSACAAPPPAAEPHKHCAMHRKEAQPTAAAGAHKDHAGTAVAAASAPAKEHSCAMMKPAAAK